MTKPNFLLIAGVNGAGKSTLFRLNPELFEGSIRINADEILQANGGDWRDDVASGRALLEAGRKMDAARAAGRSFHTETTLAARTKSYLRQIERAKNAGFEVTMVYVALASANLSMQRVEKRVQQGGHGVPIDRLVQRYDASFNNLKQIAPNVDNLYIYDNSQSLVHVYQRHHDKVMLDFTSVYPWIQL
jgi:predicted ABC-type ATPase